ncbi:ankyrin repeat-containing domain protein [Hypoxylon rubiginosum]|uniref:Ankyrin repeat-containing domain protein n=1 Tax=Hypoxylon rubiginosum TaxID=110542 RepID=A0ACC0CZA4_9PEZI|nr:ankyrin repeat-containing domain protein [Hypoxylon rubiginosum]
MAAMNGCTGVVQFLLDRRAYLLAQDDHGQTAIHLAAMNGHLETLKLILDHWARNNAQHWAIHKECHQLGTQGEGSQGEESQNKQYLRPRNIPVPRFLDNDDEYAHNPWAFWYLFDILPTPISPNWDPWGSGPWWAYLHPQRLQIGAQIRDIEGKTALHLAAKHNTDGAIVQLLLLGKTQNKHDVNAKDDKGRTALDLARSEGAVGELLECGADHKALNKSKAVMALKWALDKKATGMMKRILRDNADTEDIYLGALQYAVAQKDPDKLVLLLKLEEAVLNGNMDIVRAALELAVDIKCIEAVQLLKRANVESWYLTEMLHKVLDQTPRHFKDASNDSGITELLLEAGADPNAERSGKTLLIKATHKKATDIVRVLVHRGADVNARDLQGNTPLWVAIFHHDHHKIATQLLKAGADPNAEYKDGITILHSIVQLNWAGGLIEVLLKHGADANATYEGKTVFDQAIGNRRWDLVERILRSEKADSLRFDKLTTLFRTMEPSGGMRIPNNIFGMILRISKENIDSVDESGSTLLHLVTKWKYWGLVQMLVQHGANPNIRNNDEELPRDMIEGYDEEKGKKKYDKIIGNGKSK